MHFTTSSDLAPGMSEIQVKTSWYPNQLFLFYFLFGLYIVYAIQL